MLDNDDKKLLLRFSKVRNLIIHNESLMNKIVLEELKKLKIEHHLTENQSVSEDLDNDISKMQELFDKVSKKITDTLLNQALQVVLYDNSVIKI